MSRHVDVAAVLGDLKEFQRRTAVWAFRRMFAVEDPAVRFLVADEVGLGKTHVAKGVVAQVIDHLQSEGDVRHDIVYVCSNAAIARQNLRKLVPRGIEPLEDVERLTMLPLARLDDGRAGGSGINLLAITPGTSLRFGRQTGRFEERCLAYTFLRALWGAQVMNRRGRWIFWHGVSAENGDERLRAWEASRRRKVDNLVGDFGELLDEADARRHTEGRPPLRQVFDGLVDRLAWRRHFPDELQDARRDLIGEVRRTMAVVGITALQPDLVILDEFQRFKDLLTADPKDFASNLAHRLFDHVDAATGRPTRTLLLSATPYRMYTTADEADADHYEDFFTTCRFLFRDEAKLADLKASFAALRSSLTRPDRLGDAEGWCNRIADQLRSVMARTERLAATPDRDGMLEERSSAVEVAAGDVRSYVRFADLAQVLREQDPTEYWKSAPYLLNFMERYKLKQAFDAAVQSRLLPAHERLESGPGLLSWDDVDAYAEVDPQNARLRWLLSDLDRHRAFELLWIPPSMRYYDAGSVYETPEASKLTKRLVFSGWAVVPKVVSCLVSYEAERRSFLNRDHAYGDDYARRGGQRLTFRSEERGGRRRAASMTAFVLQWPSPTLAGLGEPYAGPGPRPSLTELLERVEHRVDALLKPLARSDPADGPVDPRWYWAAPLLLDQQRVPAMVAELLADDHAIDWEGDPPPENLLLHLAEARAVLTSQGADLRRPPPDLARVVAELAVGGPAVCSLRAISAATRLAVDDRTAVWNAAWIATGFRSFFNAPEVTALIVGGSSGGADDGAGSYWRQVVQHALEGHLQAVLDEHVHVLRDWRGHLDLSELDQRIDAAEDIATQLASVLETRTSTFRVDVPVAARAPSEPRREHRMRTRFAVAFGHQTLEDGGEARVESLSGAFNSPFWPFVLVTTSIGQEGLDFHLWSHAVVHWNLPTNPVDLEQREGRVHRYKGHAVRRNIAAAFGDTVAAAHDNGARADTWDALFEAARRLDVHGGDELVPYWVFPAGPAKIARYAPILPFSREAASLPLLRKTLAAYRLAFGQPRQEELVEMLGADRSDEELLELASRLRIDLSPPALERPASATPSRHEGASFNIAGG